MSLTKLTLSLDKETIKAAKRYSEKQKLSLSKLVARYFKSLKKEEGNFSPAVNRLLGILPDKMDTKAYKKYLEKKYKL